MAHITTKQHRMRAVIGIGGGLVCGVISMGGIYIEEYVTKSKPYMALLFIPALPLVAWGSLHLAWQRGYSSAAGCGLFILAFFVSGFVGTRSTHPLAVGLGFVFLAMLPTTVLLALPNKSRHDRRR